MDALEGWQITVTLVGLIVIPLIIWASHILGKRFDNIDNRIDQLDAKIDAKIDAKFDAILVQLVAISENFAGRIGKLEGKEEMRAERERREQESTQ